MSRICSCGQDIDRSIEPKVYSCGCECHHIAMKRCASDWHKMLNEFDSDMRHRYWQHDLPFIKEKD